MNENFYRWAWLFIFSLFAVGTLVNALRRQRDPVPVYVIDPVSGSPVTWSDPRIPGVVED